MYICICVQATVLVLMHYQYCVLIIKTNMKIEKTVLLGGVQANHGAVTCCGTPNNTLQLTATGFDQVL